MAKAKANGDVAGKPEAVERDGRGRFMPGHAYRSPGRPRGVALASYVETWQGNCGQQEFADICAQVVAMARAGSLPAARLILDKLIPAAESRLHLSVEGDLRFAGIASEDLTAVMLGELFSAIEKQRGVAAQVAAERAARLGYRIRRPIGN